MLHFVYLPSHSTLTMPPPNEPTSSQQRLYGASGDMRHSPHPYRYCRWQSNTLAASRLRTTLSVLHPPPYTSPLSLPRYSDPRICVFPQHLAHVYHSRLQYGVFEPLRRPTDYHPSRLRPAPHNHGQVLSTHTHSSLRSAVVRFTAQGPSTHKHTSCAGVSRASCSVSLYARHTVTTPHDDHCQSVPGLTKTDEWTVNCTPDMHRNRLTALPRRDFPIRCTSVNVTVFPTLPLRV